MDSERRPFIATYIEASRPFDLITAAIHREKALKRWNRAWKMQLIEQRHPDWLDLYPSVCGVAPDPRVKPEDDGAGECGGVSEKPDGRLAEFVAPHTP